MKHINKYKRHKLYQLLYLIVFSFALYFFEKELFSITIILIYLLSMFFSNTLLYEIEIESKTYVFRAYSLFYKKEELIIDKKDFISIKYKNEFFLGNDALEISYKGEFTTVKKDFYINSSPWDDLNQNIIFLKNVESNNIENIQPTIEN